MGPTSKYKDIYCANTHTVTFVVTEHEVWGNERWRDDIKDYASRTGFIYFVEHQSAIPLTVRLVYKAYVAIRVSEGADGASFTRYCAKPRQWYTELAATFPRALTTIHMLDLVLPRNGLVPHCVYRGTTIVQPYYRSICEQYAAQVVPYAVPVRSFVTYSFVLHIAPITMEQWNELIQQYCY
jgi:hypothetical protein